jgi:hypothetical protein
MKYLLLYFVDEDVDRDPGDPEGVALLEKWLADTRARGALLHGDRLRPVAEATTVQVRDREMLIADGPFAETKEQVAGYDLIECGDLDEAMEIAAGHPAAALGTVEVRPIWTP